MFLNLWRIFEDLETFKNLKEHFISEVLISIFILKSKTKYVHILLEMIEAMYI